jgi:hypothetical protein
MAIYGYSKSVVKEYGLHELAEVTFDVASRDLQRIAAFLANCASEAESGAWRSSHRHLTEFDRQWRKDHPKSDVIVIHRDSDPPAVVERS